jgi:MFS family permease
VIVGVMFITLFFSLGFRFAFGVYYSAILDETGWQRAETAAVVSASMVVYAITAALSGYLFDRLGARVLFPIGALLMGTGLVLCAGISSLGELVLSYGVLLGLSYAALGFIPHMAIVPRWFLRRRGLASALALAGVGVGSLVVSTASAEFIQRIGWRDTLWYFGIAAAAVLIPLNLIFHRPSAAHVGLLPDGVASSAETPPAAAVHNTPVRVALQSPAFWLMSLAVTMIGFCSMIIVVHQTRLLVDMGFSLSLASILFGMLGVTRTAGGLFWGPLSDRIGRAPCVAIICSSNILGLVLLLIAMQLGSDASALRMALLIGYLATFGVGQGMSPVYASTVSDLYSGKNLGTILGLLDLGFGLGSAVGPWWAGWMFDRFGNYTAVIFGVMVGTALTGVGLTAAARRRGPSPR